MNEREVYELTVQEFEEVLANVISRTLGMQLDQIAGQIQGMRGQLNRVTEEGYLLVLREVVFPAVDYIDVVLNKYEQRGSELYNLRNVKGIFDQFVDEWEKHVEQARKALELAETGVLEIAMQEFVKEIRNFRRITRLILSTCQEERIERLPAIELGAFDGRISRLSNTAEGLADWIMHKVNTRESAQVPFSVDELKLPLQLLIAFPNFADKLTDWIARLINARELRNAKSIFDQFADEWEKHVEQAKKTLELAEIEALQKAMHELAEEFEKFRARELGQALSDWDELGFPIRFLTNFPIRFYHEYQSIIGRMEHQLKRINAVLDDLRKLRRSIMEFLARYGIQEIKVRKGMKVDSSLHTVIGTGWGEGVESGKILRWVRTGFKHNERVLRRAEVIVQAKYERRKRR
jgi:molecular chaperone GrpE (heat shock protein)